MIIFAVFILSAIVYFWPAVQGKVVYAGDSINGTAATQEGIRYHQETGDYSFWTGSMFSGMPNYQIGGHRRYTVDSILYPIRWVMTAGSRNPLFILPFYLLAFSLLFRTFKVDKWISMAGAFATALSSYFFVIIAAAHNGKCYSITWMTLVDWLSSVLSLPIANNTVGED